MSGRQVYSGSSTGQGLKIGLNPKIDLYTACVHRLAEKQGGFLLQTGDNLVIYVHISLISHQLYW
jgi:hypothetical protein